MLRDELPSPRAAASGASQALPSQALPDGFKPATPGESMNGGALLVAAYIFMWVILFVWLWRVWAGQNSLSERIDGLDRAIDRALKSRASAKSPATGSSDG